VALKKAKRLYQELLAEAGSMLSETVLQIRTVRAFSAEARTQRDFRSKVETAFRFGRKIVGLRLVFETPMNFCFQACYIGFFYYSTMRIISGDIELETVTIMLIYVMQAIHGVVLLAEALFEVAECLGASTRIFEILSSRDEQIRNKRQLALLCEDGGVSGAGVSGAGVSGIGAIGGDARVEKGRYDASKLEGTVEFKEVFFRYRADKKKFVLKHLNFRVDAGSTAALVGSSGGGKSTIVSLIEGFYEASSGEILVGGLNLKDVDLTWLRANIVSIVAQEPSLFAGTVRSNIAYGRPEASDARVEEVARLANAHDFISSLEGGYEARVGERGVKLSGGQKQRIAIARALLVDAKILLLDEATSALDAESEALVQQALERVIAMSGKTVIVIAHRLSTVRRANNIFVVKEGEIAETGNHDSLMKREDGIYKKLVEGQLRFD